VQKISYLVSHPIQYFSPLFREMELTKEIDLTVYYCNDPVGRNVDTGFGKTIVWDVPLLDGYKSYFLKNFSPSSSIDNKFFGLMNFGIVKALINDQSDIIIVHGWSYFTNILAILTARFLGKKLWVRAESPLSQEIIKPKVLRSLKMIVLGYGLFRLVNKFLYIGQQNRNFYLYYGVPSSKLLYAPYTVDNSFFILQANKLRKDKIQLRNHYGFSRESVVILFSGKYIFKKRPLDLLKAFQKLKHLPVTLLMLGEGELRNEMESFIKEKELKNVFLTGFINQSEISNFYALSDLFVLPSGPGETWGLVVNEAMLFQLPVIVSSTVGCAKDLVKDGQNGFVFEEGNIDQLAESLITLVTDHELRKRAGYLSGEIIASYNYSVMIESIKSELKTSK